MNCPKCQTQNEENAQFCRNCGTSLYFSQEPSNNGKTADLLILIFLVYMFVSSLTAFAIQKLLGNWYERTKYILIGLNLIWAFSPILLSFAIKNKTGKIFGIVLASIYMIYIVYSNIYWMLI